MTPGDAAFIGYFLGIFVGAWIGWIITYSYFTRKNPNR